MNLRSRLPAVLAPLLVPLAACGGGKGGAASAIRVDTLPSGAVAVHNPEQGLWTEKTAWRAVEDLRLGQADGTGADVFASPFALEVDAYGRLYVLDSQTSEVRVFGPDGTHVRTMGRKGAGPGEVAQAVGMALAPDGTLWVVDPGNARFTVWDTAGTLRTTVQRRDGLHMFPWPGRIDRQGRLWDVGAGPDGSQGSPVLLRVDRSTGRTERAPLPPFRNDVFEVRKNGHISAWVPFTPSLRWTLDGEGRVWSGVTGQYRLALHEPGGDTLRVVERAAAPVPVSRAEMDSIPAHFKWFTDQGGEIDLSRVPRTKPAFEALRADDRGWLWVRPSLPAGHAEGALDVFDPQGRYHGRLALPAQVASSMALRIRGDRIYAIVMSDEGIPQVVRMRIEGRPEP
jgi:sugar lactone lactonase YvrE